MANVLATAKKKRHLALLQKLKSGTLTRAEINELGELEKDTTEPGIVQSQADVAKAFGVKKRTVEYWVENDMPKRDDGTYSLIDISAWRSKPKEEKPKEEGWDDKYRKAKAELAQLNLAEKRGLLIAREEVDAANVAKVLAVKRALLAIPKQIAPSLAGREAREIQARLTARLEEVIARFADGQIEPRPKVKKKGRPRKKAKKASRPKAKKQNRSSVS